MRFLDGITESRKTELMTQLRAIWTHNSTAIEGNTLTLDDTMFVLSYGLTMKGKPLKDQLDVQNHAKAVDEIMRLVDARRLAEDDVFRLHRIVINEQSNNIYKPVGTCKREDNGTYRLVDEESVYHAYLPADEVPAAMQTWLGEFNASYKLDATPDEALDAYISAHMRIASIHPFHNGNGRLARLIANLPVLFAGLPPIVVPVERREDYIKSIGDYEGGAADVTSFRSLLQSAWQSTRDFIQESRKTSAEPYFDDQKDQTVQKLTVDTSSFGKYLAGMENRGELGPIGDLSAYVQKLLANAVLFGLRDNGVIVALCAMYCNHPEKDFAFIPQINVQPKFRRKGLASAMLKRCIAYAREHDFAEIRLFVNKRNPPAQALYAKHGFVNIGETDDQYECVLKLR